jgi:hypothetical protein
VTKGYEEMQLSLVELRTICEKLFLHLEQQQLRVVELPVDYYWNIPKEQIYNPYQEPGKLDLGQLSDDWDELRKVLEENGQPLAYDFVGLAAVLRAIGEHVLT